MDMVRLHDKGGDKRRFTRGVALHANLLSAYLNGFSVANPSSLAKNWRIRAFSLSPSEATRLECYEKSIHRITKRRATDHEQKLEGHHHRLRAPCFSSVCDPCAHDD